MGAGTSWIAHQERRFVDAMSKDLKLDQKELRWSRRLVAQRPLDPRTPKGGFGGSSHGRRSGQTRRCGLPGP